MLVDSSGKPLNKEYKSNKNKEVKRLIDTLQGSPELAEFLLTYLQFQLLTMASAICQKIYGTSWIVNFDILLFQAATSQLDVNPLSEYLTSSEKSTLMIVASLANSWFQLSGNSIIAVDLDKWSSDLEENNG